MSNFDLKEIFYFIMTFTTVRSEIIRFISTKVISYKKRRNSKQYILGIWRVIILEWKIDRKWCTEYKMRLDSKLIRANCKCNIWPQKGHFVLTFRAAINISMSILCAFHPIWYQICSQLPIRGQETMEHQKKNHGNCSLSDGYFQTKLSASPSSE